MEIQSDRATIVNEQPPQVIVPTATGDVGYLAPQPSTATVVTTRTSWFTPAALVASLAAIALLVVGGITVARAGLDGPLDEPVISAANYTATAILGLIELAFGVVLLSAALSRSREGILFIGIVGGVMALIAVFEPTIGNGALAIERPFAVIVALVMAAVVVSALLPSIRRSNTQRRVA
ncbi:MAG: hypothetical protein ABMA25_24085 [Ilumatobacteraceae bacterium]